MQIQELTIPLSEALRMSNAAKAQVLRNERDFLVGVGIEFHVSPAAAGLADPTEDPKNKEKVFDLVRKESNNTIDQVVDFMDEFMDLVGDWRETVAEMREDPRFSENLLGMMEEFVPSFPVDKKGLLSEFIISVSEVNQTPNFVDVVDRFQNYLTMVDPFSRDNGIASVYVEDLAKAIIPFATQSLSVTRKSFTEALEDTNTFRLELVGVAAEEGLGKVTDGLIEYIEGIVYGDLGLKSKIEKIEEDASVDNGVEVVTRPLIPSEAMKVTKKILSIVDGDKIRTSNRTGLHVNISHRSFMRGKVIAPSKLLAMMDVEFFQGITSSEKSPVKFEVRNRLIQPNLLVPMSSERNLEKLAYAMNEGGFDNLESTLNMMLSMDKFQAVNISHLLSLDAATKRIEFRFFGGEGYEKRMSEIENDVTYLMFVIQSITSLDFNRRTYIMSVLRVLNRYTNRVYGMSFPDLMKMVKQKES